VPLQKSKTRVQVFCEGATVHPRHSQNASSMLPAASQLIFAHEMALSSCLPGSRFSCKHEICCEGATVHPRHSQNASSMLPAASQLIFAHEMALPSCLPGSRFSCKHEICCQEGTSELWRHTPDVVFIYMK